jgi:hypothetical protein
MLRRSARSASIAPQGNEDADHGIDPKTGVEALGQPEARGRRRSDDVAGVWEATVVLAKRYQDRIADALSGEALPLFKYYGIVRLAEEFASEWGGPHLVHRAEKLVSIARVDGHGMPYRRSPQKSFHVCLVGSPYATTSRWNYHN